MSGIYTVPADVFTALIIAVIASSVVFGAFWAIRSYTEFNNKHKETRESNPYKLNYAIGTLVAIGLAGAVSFGLTVWATVTAVGADAEAWVYVVVAIILAFFVAGFMVKAVHMGIETAIKWARQGVKEVATNAAELMSEVAEYKAMLGESAAQIKALQDQIAALTPKQ